ncbi:MAG: hypothetical protein HQ446_07335 [Polaromonas sp.]|nr:hypothetical protein [Polaromonas sp.]
MKSNTGLLAKTFMVAALASHTLASQAQDGISKSAVTLGQSAALTGPSATLGVPFAQGNRWLAGAEPGRFSDSF